MTRGKERAHDGLASEDRPAASTPAEQQVDRDERSDASSDSWLSRAWPHVQIRDAAVLSERGSESLQDRIRAVVQLDGLTPADVVVTAQRVSSPAERTQSETLRLWSVQSHHNGEVVFEALATKQHDLDRMSYLLVTVEPAASAPGERTLAGVERLVETHVVAGDSPR